MRRERYIRRSYAGRKLPRRPAYPDLFRRRTVTGVPARAAGLLARLALFAVLLSVTMVAASVGGAYSAYAQIAASLTPRLDALDNRESFETSRIFDRNGTLLYEFFDAGKRTQVTIDEVSPLLIQATIAIEDQTFFTNPGIDLQGIVRTLITSLRAGEETGGASTITQQVIKNSILTEEERLYENRYQRKIKEIILAQELDKRFNKEDVLELYLNEIFYGNLAYGIEAASEVYFDTNASDLTLSQAALLAGLPQLPSRYNPINYLQRDDDGGFLPGVQVGDDWLDPDYELPADVTPPRWRQAAVLRRMVEDGYVKEAEARAALATDLRFAPQEVPLNAPHFVFYVRDLLEERYGQQLLNGGGLSITTTLDLDLQRMAQQKAAERIAELDDRNIHNAAVVMMQPNTGQILAMVGSIDFNAIVETDTPDETGNVLDGQVNVTTRERQPGSALKPFTYLAAMEKGMTPASVLWDVPTEFPIGGGRWYAPENYNQRWNGPVRIRTALANSLNMPAVKALQYAGIDYTLEVLDRVGIKDGLKRGSGFYGLSLTLGGGEVTPLELTTAYNTLASNGRYYPPVSILEISDADGNVLEAYEPGGGEQVVDPALAALLTDMLSDDRARQAIWGLNSPLKLSWPAAVKTGTTNDWRDAWAAGYTPFLTVGVWTGNNNNEPTARVESLSGGGIIWRNVMEETFSWINTRAEYRELFGRPFGGNVQVNFLIPDTGLERRNMCALPGSFGGYSAELFTNEMLEPDADDLTPGSALTPTAAGSSNRRLGCDIFDRFTVIQIPDFGEDGEMQADDENTRDADLATARYCRPVAGESYPPELQKTLTVWNVPDPNPGERIEYRWSGGSAANQFNADDFPLCEPVMFEPPEPQPPVAGAVEMPDLSRLGENQARELLTRMGVTAIYVDYQTRERIPDIFDDYLPYTVVSTLPTAGDWIIPGTTVILGIRAPDSAPIPATPVTEPPANQPPPQPTPEPPPGEPPPGEPPPIKPTPPNLPLPPGIVEPTPIGQP
jgi:peptidoglycan glycosyltransferase